MFVFVLNKRPNLLRAQKPVYTQMENNYIKRELFYFTWLFFVFKSSKFTAVMCKYAWHVFLITCVSSVQMSDMLVSSVTYSSTSNVLLQYHCELINIISNILVLNIRLHSYWLSHSPNDKWGSVLYIAGCKVIGEGNATGL